jgi:hypothetical protein
MPFVPGKQVQPQRSGLSMPERLRWKIPCWYLHYSDVLPHTVPFLTQQSGKSSIRFSKHLLLYSSEPGGHTCDPLAQGQLLPAFYHPNPGPPPPGSLPSLTRPPWSPTLSPVESYGNYYSNTNLSPYQTANSSQSEALAICRVPSTEP